LHYREKKGGNMGGRKGRTAREQRRFVRKGDQNYQRGDAKMREKRETVGKKINGRGRHGESPGETGQRYRETGGIDEVHLNLWWQKR